VLSVSLFDPERTSRCFGLSAEIEIFAMREIMLLEVLGSDQGRCVPLVRHRGEIDLVPAAKARRRFVTLIPK
jgi:hypothetical protein